jgi:hypothetical protein
MFDNILSGLAQQALPKLMGEHGLNEQQAKGTVHAAAESVKEVIGGGNGFGMDDVLNLFSNAKNTPAADGILNNITNTFSSKLAGQVGLSGQQAGGVASMMVPMITNLISSHVGGNAGNLQGLVGGLLGGNAGGLGNVASGLLGKLFK